MKSIKVIYIISYLGSLKHYLILLFLILQIIVFSQNASVGINKTGVAPNSKAMLDIDVTGMSPKAGILFPRLTSLERDAITGHIPESLIIYNTDTHCFEAYYTSSWVAFGCINCQISPTPPASGINIPSGDKIVWNWNTVNGATGYQWNTTSAYPGSGVNELINPTYTQTGIICNTSYSLYIWTYNNCGNSSMTLLTQNSGSCCSVNCSGSGNIGTMAGNGTSGFKGDNGPAVCAQLSMGYPSTPPGIAVDNSGNVYIADNFNQAIRKVTVSTGIINTIAGTGKAGYSGDGAAATNAQLNFPSGVAIDGSGNIYFSDAYNHVIRKINASSGIINTIAGTGFSGFSDGTPATNQQLNFPTGIAVDGSGNVYVADYSNKCIRKISGTTISTIAGGVNGGWYNGDGSPATNYAVFPTGVAVDESGNIYIADYQNNRIRKVTSGGTISTIAGTGTAGYNGDGISATTARLNNPVGIALSGTHLYISDFVDYRIRKFTVGGNISTIAGTGISGYSGDGGLATNAGIDVGYGVAVDASGNVFIIDGERIREICK